MIDNGPTLELRRMTKNDLNAAHALSVEVGWPHRPEDWRFVFSIGSGVVAHDEAERIVGVAMWWAFGATAGTIGMVIVSPRLQTRGTGSRLMDAVIEEAGDRVLQLNATKEGLRLYEAKGFVPIAKVQQYQGIAANPSGAAKPVKGLVRNLNEEDWPAVAALDRAACGADRSLMLRELQTSAVGQVLEVNSKLTGFSLCRTFGRGHVVGPIVATDDDAAIALLRPHLADHAGRYLRVDTSSADSAFTRFLTDHGLTTSSGVVTMTRGPAWRSRGPARIYGLVNQALG
jgi:GNAT superfamily N-acetyltransferase